MNAMLETAPAPEAVPRNTAIKPRSGSKARTVRFSGPTACRRYAGSLPGGRTDPRLYNAAATGLSETTAVRWWVSGSVRLFVCLLAGRFSDRHSGKQMPKDADFGNANSIKINGVDETSRASTRSGGIVGYWKDEAA